MGKEKFLMLSLDDSQAKKIANVMNNDSSRKILDFLTENEATESEIAKKLKIPISTVHYNLQQLLETKLIEWNRYHYSEKGKEVRHYTVANKYIIIAPKGDNSDLKEKLKTILPTTLLTLLGAGFIHLFQRTEGTLVADSRMVESTAMMMEAAPVEEVARESIFTILYNSSAFWFLVGGIFVVGTYFAIRSLRKKFFKQRL